MDFECRGDCVNCRNYDCDWYEDLIREEARNDDNTNDNNSATCN